MSSPQIIKLNSSQAGPFNAQQNIVEFEIPEGGVYNLRDSYLSFNCVIETLERGTNATAANGQGVYPVKMVWESVPELKIPNVSLVRDASITSERRGQIENIRHMDQLRTNLGYYSESVAASHGNAYLDMSPWRPMQDAAAQPASIFRELQKSGDAPSRNLTIAPIQIALEDMFDFCKTDEYDTSRAGRTVIRTRLNIDKLEAVRISEPTVPMDPEGLKVEGTIAIGESYDELVPAASYKSLEQTPFHVGQRILINATGAGFTEKSILIRNIFWSDQNDGKLSIQTEGNWVTNSAVELTDVVISFVSHGDANSPGVSFSINYAEIVLKDVPQPQGYDEINFNTFGIEQTNGNALTSYRNIFTIQPECTNVLVLFPTNDLLSETGGDDSSYNLRLNNEDLTDNRDIVFGTSLDKDRVNIGLTNMGVKPRTMLQNGGKTDVISSNAYTDTDFSTRIIAAPLRVTTQQKLLQLVVDDNVGIEELSVFTELPRIFSY